MLQWEYNVSDNPSVDDLDQLGAEGWEHVAVVGDFFAQKAYLKRPVSARKRRAGQGPPARR
jgi:hypothetical protein